MKTIFYLIVSCIIIQNIYAAQYNYQTPEDFWNDVAPIKGPTKVDVGYNAEIKIPEGYIFLNREDSKKFCAFTENLYNNEIGTLVSLHNNWNISFSYINSGYIKEEKIDSNALFKTIKSGEAENNRQREKLGYQKLYLQDWFIKPLYNPMSNNLEWAFLIKQEDGRNVVNYNVRILGRRGYINAKLVMFPSQKTAISELQNILSDLTFKEGSRYAEWKPGDKVAKYGMAALITGGVITVAAKTGILAKFWKLIVFGIVAIFSAILKILKKIAGKD